MRFLRGNSIRRRGRKGVGGCAALLLPALLLAACATGENATARLAQEFGDVEIRRIGDYDPGYIEFQDRAMVNAFGVITRAGFEPEAITQVTVSTPAPVGQKSSSNPFFDFPPYYELWVAVEGCEKSIYFRSGSAGGLQAMNDRARCLSGG